MQAPPPRNPSSLFCSGSPAALASAVAACHTHGVSLFGALLAVVATALTVLHKPTAAGVAAANTSRRIPLALSTDVDLRGHFEAVPELNSNAVGMYTAPCSVPELGGRGLAANVPFWAAAAAAEAEAGDSERVHAAVLQQGGEGLKRCDAAWEETAAASWLGRYPYPLAHSTEASSQPAADVHTGLAAGAPQLRVRSLHWCASHPEVTPSALQPAETPSAVFSLAATQQIDFSCTHRLQKGQGKRLFDMVVAGVEAVGTVQDGETVAAFAARVWGGAVTARVVGDECACW